MDEKNKKVKRTYYLGLFMHPLTLFPFVAGVTLFGLLAVLGKSLSWLFAAGGILLSVGMLFTRTILQGEKILRKAIEEVECESQKQWKDSLDGLDGQLRKDNDTRDEKLLCDLRALFEAIQTDKAWMGRFDPSTVDKLRVALVDSFNNSIEKLKAALELKISAEKNDNNRVRKLLLEDRENLLNEVKQSVEEFESVFNELRDVRSEKKTDPNNCLARLRQTLEIGKRVKKRQESLGLGDFE